MKIGILKETKFPIDNRVPLTPEQIKYLQTLYPHIEFYVQSSSVRAFSDQEYVDAGIKVVDSLENCDLLLGIKEADINTLLPKKHYLFFGHIAKEQPYNKPLFKRLLELNTTFSDYEYLTDDSGNRLVAFGWYAGVVGTYYTFLGWGNKNKVYNLPMPEINSTVKDLIANLKSVKIGPVKIIITGNGRVSKGAQYILENIGFEKLSPKEFIEFESNNKMVFCVLNLEDLVENKNKKEEFNKSEFKKNPKGFKSIFDKYYNTADILISCHFWGENDPVYLNESDFLTSGFRIKMIGDITCDIKGSLKSTLRASTHNSPFYDYNPFTTDEEKPFSSSSNVSVMAVDTCPNALPRITSEYFGNELIKYILTDILKHNNDRTKVIDRATIIREGKLTSEFDYLTNYVDSFYSPESK